MGAQSSARRARVARFTAAAVVLVAAGVVAFAGTATRSEPRPEPARGTTEVTVSAWVAEAYSLRPDAKPDRACRYPYQVLVNGQRLVWVGRESPLVAPPDVRGAWLLVSPETNVWMWFTTVTPYVTWQPSVHNEAGSWFAVPQRAVTWCGAGEPSARAPR